VVVAVDVLPLIHDLRAQVADALLIDHPRFFVGDERLDKYQPPCFYRAPDEIRVEGRPRTAFRVRMPDGSVGALRRPRGSRASEVRRAKPRVEQFLRNVPNPRKALLAMFQEESRIQPQVRLSDITADAVVVTEVPPQQILPKLVSRV
jgi:hypothetical protein